MRHDTAVTKQCTAKWPYIANAVFRIVQNNGEFSYFGRFQGWQSSPPGYPHCAEHTHVVRSPTNVRLSTI